MPLYLVQDADSPMYVVAQNYGEAIKKWAEWIKKQDEYSQEYNPEPEGVSKIADDYEVIN